MNPSLFDKRFYGIYRAVVVDNNDPLNKNRLKVKVPQVTGTSVTNWALPCVSYQSSPIYTPVTYYGEAYSTLETTIVQSGTASSTEIPIDTASSLNNVSLSSNAFIPTTSGTYKITSTLQFVCTSGSSDIDVEIWLARTRNGVVTNLPGTDHVVTLKGAGHNVIDMHTEVLDLLALDEVRIFAVASGPNVRLEAFTANTLPDRPTGYSVDVRIESINLQIPFQSDVGSGVWVMYEGGDPNFPVWMGVL